MKKLRLHGVYEAPDGDTYKIISVREHKHGLYNTTDYRAVVTHKYKVDFQHDSPLCNSLKIKRRKK